MGEQKEADEAALDGGYLPNPSAPQLPSSLPSPQPAAKSNKDIAKTVAKHGKDVGKAAFKGAKTAGKAAFKGAKTAAPIVVKSTKKTAGKILGALGAMGGGVHQALKESTKMVEKRMERGRIGRQDLIAVEEDGPVPQGEKKNISRLKPMAPQDASLVGRVMQYKVLFQILFAILFFLWVFKTTGSFF